MADQRDQRRGDEQEQDGLGRDAAHGGGRDDTTGGSYGRSTGRAGDDLSGSSDADARRGGREGRDAGGARIPRGTDEQSGDPLEMDRDGRVVGGSGDADAVDPDATPEVRRRDPTR